MSVIEVFADVRCPFTHVGLRRLVERREELGADVTLRVRAWPLELVNDAPLDPGLVANEIEALRTQVAGDLFRGFDRARFPASSLPALGLAAAAYEQDLAAGERLSLLLRDALFEQGRDIAQPDELAALAADAGVPEALGRPDVVVADWHEGQARGVIGSPHFFVGDRGYFCPMLDIRHEDGRFDISRRDGFLDELLRGTTG